MSFRFGLIVALVLAGTASGQVEPGKVLETMKPGPGLQVELFAHEPMLLNPTSLDVDHKGRVWVAEAVNYRCKLFNKPLVRPEGDRIQILIDEKGEGKATKAITFYQGPELYNPLGVLVIPNVKTKTLRVLVAQSPDILEFSCKDEAEPKAEGKPKKFLTGFGGFDHDHGVHGLNLGPDGKLYFTVGDSGVTGLQSSDRQGKKYVSNSTDVHKGTVWRCDLDGKNLELIAHNFRNNYECCVDSFGEIWLSDNDDDGNQQTRICFVMPGGNYGYGPRGAGQTHWHEEQPGIVHKVLRTGFGSPTGITFYEGTLLPKQYHGDLIHCDAGPREVRYFKRVPKGAGYELEKTVMLTSTDTWFRPSGVRVAPDGSVFIADWYDPGVGGHRVGDTKQGRIFRLTPTGHKGYKVPEIKLDKAADFTEALKNPNATVRALTFQQTPTDDQNFDIKELMAQNPYLAARLYWRSTEYLATKHDKWQGIIAAMLLQENDPRFQSLGVRLLAFLARYQPDNDQTGWGKLLELAPPSMPVLRESLLLARTIPESQDLSAWFYTAAKRYAGEDIFYRAALNIACGTDPERRDKILADFEKHFPDWNDKVADLVWELRPKSMLPKMEKLISDAQLTDKQKGRIVDILAVYDSADAGKTLLSLLTTSPNPEIKARALENLKLFLPTKWNDLVQSGKLNPLLAQLLKDPQQQRAGLTLVAAIKHGPSVPAVTALATDRQTPREVQFQAYQTLGELGTVPAVKGLLLALNEAPTKLHTKVAVEALALPLGRKLTPAGELALARLIPIARSDEPDTDIRSAAIAGLAGSYAGTEWLLDAQEKKLLPESALPEVGRLLRNSPFQLLRNRALMAFPAPGKLDPKNLPPIPVLAKRIGNAERGKSLMMKSISSEVQCLKCHMVRGQGGFIGPDLSMIGKKGGKENLLESILYPSRAISDQYLTWKVDTEDGQTITGLLVEETETRLTLRDANGKDYQLPVQGSEKKKQLTSIMPEGLVATLSEEELMDLVEYLTTLQTPTLTPDSWYAAGPIPLKEGVTLDTASDAEKLPFDVGAKFKLGEQSLTWKTLRVGSNGYFDLAAFHGKASSNSMTVLTRVVESPSEQDATILLGADDGCRVLVNGTKVFGHDRAEAARPERDTIPIKLKKGVNTLTLKISNGNDPHGFYFSLTSKDELKLLK